MNRTTVSIYQTTRGYNTWLQHVVTTRGYNTWLQHVVTLLDETFATMRHTKPLEREKDKTENKYNHPKPHQPHFDFDEGDRNSIFCFKFRGASGKFIYYQTVTENHAPVESTGGRQQYYYNLTTS